MFLAPISNTLYQNQDGTFGVQNTKYTSTYVPWWQEKIKQTQKALGVQQAIGLLVHLTVSLSAGQLREHCPFPVH